MNEVRSTKRGGGSPWTIEQVKAGFVRYVEETGHYPNADEIDMYEYLPTSRSIQRSFGGLVELRKKFFPEAISSYTTGQYRTDMASKMYRRAQGYEERFWDQLTNHFQEIAIHEQKRIRPGSVASDFFIFTDEHEGVCLDLFFAQNMRSVANVINIKLKRYSQLHCPVIFVVIGDDNIDNDKINAQLANRKNPLPAHVKVNSEKYFWETTIPKIKKKSAYALF